MILELLKIHTFQDSQAVLHQVSILFCKSWHSFLSAFIFKSWFRILTVTTFLLFANVGSFLLLMVSQMDFDPTILFSINCSCNLRRSFSVSKNSLGKLSGNTFFVSTLNNTSDFSKSISCEQNTYDIFVTLSSILSFLVPVSWRCWVPFGASFCMLNISRKSWMIFPISDTVRKHSSSAFRLLAISLTDSTPNFLQLCPFNCIFFS